MIFEHREEDGTKFMMSTEAGQWPQLIADFKNFLRGCGYIIPYEGDNDE